jgi:hypothetical protein
MSLTREQTTKLGEYFRSKVEDVKENPVCDHIVLENGEEYDVYADYESAEHVALDYLTDSLQDSIDLENVDAFEQYVKMPKSDKESYAFNAADSQLEGMDEADIFNLAGIEGDSGAIEDELNDIKEQLSEEESPEQEKHLYEQIKRLKEKLKKSGDSDTAYQTAHAILYRKCLSQLDDPLGYFVWEIGYELKDLLKNGTLTINWAEYAQDIIDHDGVGNQLNQYDGEEHQVSGMYVYRTD